MKSPKGVVTEGPPVKAAESETEDLTKESQLQKKKRGGKKRTKSEMEESESQLPPKTQSEEGQRKKTKLAFEGSVKGSELPQSMGSEETPHAKSHVANEGGSGLSENRGGKPGSKLAVEIVESGIAPALGGNNTDLGPRSRKPPTRFGHNEEDGVYEAVVDAQIVSSDSDEDELAQDRITQASKQVTRKAKSTKQPREPKPIGGTPAQEIAWLKAKNKQLQVEKQVLADKNKVLSTAARDSAVQEKVLDKEAKDLTKECQKLRTANQKLATRQGPEVEDDDSVRMKLEKMATSCKDWSKDFAIKSFSEVEVVRLEEMREVLCKDTTPGAADSSTGITSMEMWSKGPSILLNALLARRICNQIFDRPFFFLENGVNPDVDPYPAESSLNSLYAHLKKRHEQKAHLWRSLTEQVLATTDSQNPGNDEGGNEYAILNLKEKFYSRTALAFRDSPMVKLLLATLTPDMVTKREAKLLSIVKNAGDLACSLFSHKAAIVSRTKVFYKTPFKIGNGEMEPHATLWVEDNDKRLDGRKVDLVVQPGIWAYGNEHGENYKKHKVWLRSTVWMVGGKKEAKK